MTRGPVLRVVPLLCEDKRKAERCALMIGLDPCLLSLSFKLHVVPNYWVPVRQPRNDHRRRHAASEDAAGAFDTRESRPHTVLRKSTR